jgi:23S rRNA-/tRNA-specific pseudouridylate synthase
VKPVYRDQGLAVFDKKPGIPTAPGKLPSLCDTVFTYFPSLAGVNGYRQGEGGLLNRLDNETGGLVLFAENDESFLYYSKLMKSGKVTKRYHAIVDGIPGEKTGSINIPIAHHPHSKKRMVACVQGSEWRGKPRDARTCWKLLDSQGGRSLVECTITSGARHQIRVHLKTVGLPINGDRLYNKTGNPALTDYHMLYAVGIDCSREECLVSISVEPSWKLLFESDNRFD